MNLATKHFQQRMRERAIDWREARDVVEDGEVFELPNGYERRSKDGTHIILAPCGAPVTGYTDVARTAAAVATHPDYREGVLDWIRPLGHRLPVDPEMLVRLLWCAGDHFEGSEAALIAACFGAEGVIAEAGKPRTTLASTDELKHPELLRLYRTRKLAKANHADIVELSYRVVIFKLPVSFAVEACWEGYRFFRGDER